MSDTNNIISFEEAKNAIKDKTLPLVEKPVKPKRTAKPKTTTTELTATPDIWNSDKIIPVEINDTLTIKVNPFPTIEEKIAFIQKVVNDSFLDDTDVYFVRTKAIYEVLYLAMFTDYKFPDTVKTDGFIEVEAAYNHLKEYDLDTKFKAASNKTSNLIENIRTELWKDIKQRIEGEKSKRIALLSRNFELEETLDNLNLLITSAISFITKIGEFSPENLHSFLTLLDNGIEASTIEGE